MNMLLSMAKGTFQTGLSEGDSDGQAIMGGPNWITKISKSGKRRQKKVRGQCDDGRRECH
jgi:hypothetical protein